MNLALLHLARAILRANRDCRFTFGSDHVAYNYHSGYRLGLLFAVRAIYGDPAAKRLTLIAHTVVAREYAP